MIGLNCPGCGHGHLRHVGGMCYGPRARVMTALGWWETVSACFCGYSFLDNQFGKGWVENIDIDWREHWYTAPETAWWEA